MRKNDSYDPTNGNIILGDRASLKRYYKERGVYRRFRYGGFKLKFIANYHIGSYNVGYDVAKRIVEYG